MKKLLLTIALLVSGLLPGCSSSNSSRLTSIQVTPANPSIAAGLQQQFTATGTYSDKSSKDLTATASWSSSNTGVATIGTGGLAKSTTAGSTTITASQSGITGTATLQVTAAALVSIAVTPTTPTIPVGTLQQFTATGTFTDGSNQDLTATVNWSSDTPTVASIASGGRATAKTIGSALITAASGSTNGNTSLTVAAASLVSLTISGGDVTIANGTTHQFTAIGIYNDGSRHNLSSQVTWGSSLTSVATIAAGGRATAVSPGSSSITAVLGSVSALPVTLTVSNATITAIAVGPSTRTIAPLTQQAFTAIGTFSDASTQNITHDATWSSSKPAVATVSNTSGSIGIATGVGPGTANISAALGGATGLTPLNVTNATLTSITLTPSSAGMVAGSTVSLGASGNFSDGTHQSINAVATWSSSDPTVATVSNTGIVTAVANGPAVITAQLGSVNQGANITVESLTALAVSPASATFAQDTSTQLMATGTLTDSSTQDLTGSVIWTSSDPAVVLMSVAAGSKGSAQGQTAGTSTVTAAFSGLVGSSQLTVTNATLSTITVKPTNPDIALGNPQQFSAQGTFSDGTTQNLTQQVTWSSSDINVAIIEPSGAASTTGVGTTTITAALNGVTGTTVLTVH